MVKLSGCPTTSILHRFRVNARLHHCGVASMGSLRAYAVCRASHPRRIPLHHHDRRLRFPRYRAPARPPRPRSTLARARARSCTSAKRSVLRGRCSTGTATRMGSPRSCSTATRSVHCSKAQSVWATSRRCAESSPRSSRSRCVRREGMYYAMQWLWMRRS